MTEEAFRDLVADALDSLPEDITALMENVEVVVEDEPPAESLARLPRGGTLLGEYRGFPLTARGMNYEGALPDKISIFKGPIERMERTPNGIREQVRRTVMHEIGHHFGMDEDRLEELGWG
ncbi:MAG: metallopeptidase family protein [Actinomycetota bacterium]|nr:metallopeptidase family protein [Actinomycetota bacterium]